MPELPEIQTVRLQLQKVLPGKVIRKIEVLKERSFHGKPESVIGKKIRGVERMAKVLLVDVEGVIEIAFHFKMTGQLIWVSNNERIAGGHPTQDFTGPLPSKHTRVVFHFDGGTLYFNDQRLFGWVKTGTKEEIRNMKFLQELGPEPFDINADEFTKLVEKSKRPIKLVLMDQTVVSGIGNIYANDALWEAKINPRRLANTLKAQQYKDLYTAVIKVLNEGIKYGGATAADAKYINLEGLGGHYQDHFRVYDKEGDLCARKDGGVIHKLALGGRGTYFCPKCQEA